MYLCDKIIKGERLQQTADIYLGTPDDFQFNPLIQLDTTKHCDFNLINGPFNNPKRVFCYSHKLDLLSTKIHFFMNPFVLISHNSDGNINESEYVHKLTNYPLLIKWYTQNLSYNHPKIHALPIGMANNQWAHGNVSFFSDAQKIENLHKNKQNKVYFNFNIYTNPIKRNECYMKLKNKIPMQPNMDPLRYLHNLSTHEFCICPEGNGYDTHRLWEALYVKCIPIVIKSKHIDILQKQLDIPLVILDSWDDFDISKLDYTAYTFSDNYYEKITMDYFTKRFNEELDYSRNA